MWPVDYRGRQLPLFYHMFMGLCPQIQTNINIYIRKACASTVKLKKIIISNAAKGNQMTDNLGIWPAV